MSAAGSGRARVMVRLAVGDGQESRVQEAYRRISSRLHETPGLLANELLRDPDDPSHYVVLSEWESLAAFRTWEDGPVHKDMTSPLRQFVRGATVYEVAGAF